MYRSTEQISVPTDKGTLTAKVAYDESQSVYFVDIFGSWMRCGSLQEVWDVIYAFVHLLNAQALYEQEHERLFEFIASEHHQQLDQWLNGQTIRDDDDASEVRTGSAPGAS